MKKTKLEIDGTIRTLTIIERENESGRDEFGKIVVMNKEGDKVVVTGPKHILDGYRPGEPVVMRLTRTNKTIAEATGAA